MKNAIANLFGTPCIQIHLHIRLTHLVLLQNKCFECVTLTIILNWKRAIAKTHISFPRQVSSGPESRLNSRCDLDNYKDVLFDEEKIPQTVVEVERGI